ncbi:hypothetical protein PpBr36_03200 [Pyricularia pennisetigena]|uniref:hypothetical protein n=1 Tax=Pyricularia pennisetigena TaxID=1578925 RepID=UPI0011515605|nr:hypothetical protein PpBr36_03200 [Pyricularia pennisetigena]TLS31269.1 hypothetical protein PpBr36_03200 [Pyricularia pennisetigena]
MPGYFTGTVPPIRYNSPARHSSLEWKGNTMASPPAYTQSPIALSPPQPSNSQLPLTAAALRNNASAVIGNKKRPSITGDGTTSTVNKRRKASTMSVTSVPPGSAHPLRQTSFPPEDMGGPRSPSAFSDNMSIVSGSQVSAVGSGVGPLLKKKRGRKSKAEKAREAELAKATGSSAAPSVGGGAGGGAADGKSVAGGGKGGEEHAEEEEDNEDNVHMSITSAKRSEAQAQEEKRLRAMLTRCMDADQFDRYSNWRAAKLPDPVVRRIVNATVSQSVPLQVVTAVRTVTKFYLCDIIMIARQVQAEWIASGEEPQAAPVTENEDGSFEVGEEIPWPGKVMSAAEEEAAEEAAAVSQGDSSATLNNSFTEGGGGASASFASRIDERDRQKREVILREPPRGPLRPDHLREAVRRYQASAQSQGIGSLRVWQEQQKNGVERFPIKTGGKRIFR